MDDRVRLLLDRARRLRFAPAWVLVMYMAGMVLALAALALIVTGLLTVDGHIWAAALGLLTLFAILFGPIAYTLIMQRWEGSDDDR